MAAQIVLGLGSNVGDRRSNIERAITALGRILHNARVSSWHETPAQLLPGAPMSWNQPYLNVAVAGSTSLSKKELFQNAKSLEHAIGRTQRSRWAPREIDIDILAWDETVADSTELRIPHPRLLGRDFALRPLAELWPDWQYPRPGLHFQETAASLVSALPLPKTELVGILNVTPDSFSDGGKWLDAQAACDHANTMTQAGAAVIDVGAESTRPGAQPLGVEEEWSRLEPVLDALRGNNACVVSVDTRHTEVAIRAIEAGAHWINDVTGFSSRSMIETIARSSVDVVAMHSLSVPPRKDLTLPENCDPMGVVVSWAEKKLQEFAAHGITEERVILDPGIGFGKTPRQNLALLRDIDRLVALGTRVLVGHSRKSFLETLTLAPPAQRDAETLALSLELARNNVDYLRVHNIDLHARALRAVWSLR